MTSSPAFAARIAAALYELIAGEVTSCEPAAASPAYQAGLGVDFGLHSWSKQGRIGIAE